MYNSLEGEGASAQHAYRKCCCIVLYSGISLIIKVKYVLKLNQSEIPGQHHYANIATAKRKLLCGPLEFHFLVTENHINLDPPNHLLTTWCLLFLCVHY